MLSHKCRLILHKTFIITRRFASSTKIIDKLLIANRGEIACRIIRTARRLGIQTVAVYSEPDKNAQHVSMADEAYYIGPASSLQSYLRGDKIIEIAKTTNSKAIHPGYGFLSENAEFAKLCESENIIFVGPPASAIHDMGIKSTSKSIMSAANVPVIEGYHGDDQSTERLVAEAKRIGFPVMIKAIRGGGGKGMRIAHTESEFLSALESAKNESSKSFGDDNMLLEQYIQEPRHVEVQVFADKHGNCVHLFERDCSVQRRHQKIIEEAPAPGISSELREALGAAAVRAAKAVNYVGAGTVEFILNKSNHKFHFMEMNTRLQVEHPVTEMITNTDLVEWQLKIAAGEKLPVTQNEIILNGHAFEGRIYAEDPSENFLPRSGPLRYLTTPRAASDVRIETGVREGDEVSVHYDPMIAKLVVWGKDRTEALSKFIKALSDYNIAGLDTNVNFLINLAKHPEFMLGNVHTGFIRQFEKSLFPKQVPTNTLLAKLALSTLLHEQHFEFERAKVNNDICNPFVLETGFRINYNFIREIKFSFDNEPLLVQVCYKSPTTYDIRFNPNDKWVKISGHLKEDNGHFKIQYEMNGVVSSYKFVVIDNEIHIFDKERHWKFIKSQPKFITKEDSKSDATDIAIAPMPGIIEKINVSIGDSVKKGDALFVLIAMKMEYVIRANRDGQIEKINFNVGDNISKNAVVIEFKHENEVEAQLAQN